MKGKRQKYIEYMKRRLVRLCNDVEFFLLLPDAGIELDKTFIELKSLVETLHLQTKDDD